MRACIDIDVIMIWIPKSQDTGSVALRYHNLRGFLWMRIMCLLQWHSRKSNTHVHVYTYIFLKKYYTLKYIIIILYT